MQLNFVVFNTNGNSSGMVRGDKSENVTRLNAVFASVHCDVLQFMPYEGVITMRQQILVDWQACQVLIAACHSSGFEELRFSLPFCILISTFFVLELCGFRLCRREEGGCCWKGRVRVCNSSPSTSVVCEMHK